MVKWIDQWSNGLTRGQGFGAVALMWDPSASRRRRSILLGQAESARIEPDASPAIRHRASYQARAQAAQRMANRQMRARRLRRGALSLVLHEHDMYPPPLPCIRACLGCEHARVVDVTVWL